MDVSLSVRIDGLRLTILCINEDKFRSLKNFIIKKIFGLNHDIEGTKSPEEMDGFGGGEEIAKRALYRGYIKHPRTKVHVGMYSFSSHGYLTIALTGMAFTWFYQKFDDYNDRVRRLHKVLERNDAKIRRVDFAMDDWSGKLGIAYAMDSYGEGGFKVRGQEPKADLHPSGRKGEGMSWTVGNRKNGKSMHIYEKGLKVKSKHHPKWVRWELRLSNDDRKYLIPLKCLLSPSAVFEKAYPVTRSMDLVTDEVEFNGNLLRERKARGKVDIEKTLNGLKNSYGAFIKYLVENRRINGMTLIEFTFSDKPYRRANDLEDVDTNDILLMLIGSR